MNSFYSFSKEWFSNRISEFANDLRKPIPNRTCLATNSDIGSPIIIKDGTIKVLTNLALEFDDLANTCLLVLHLEVVNSLEIPMFFELAFNFFQL